MSSEHLSNRNPDWVAVAQTNARKTEDVILECWASLGSSVKTDFTLQKNGQNFLVANDAKVNNGKITFLKECRIKPDIVCYENKNPKNIIYIEAKNQKGEGNATERAAIKNYPLFELEKQNRKLKYYPFFIFFLFGKEEPGLTSRLKSCFKNPQKIKNFDDTIEADSIGEYISSWRDYLYMSRMDNSSLKQEIVSLLELLVHRLKNNTEDK